MRIAVCWKWVSLDGELDPDARWAGVSAADEAALEIALQVAGSYRGGGRPASVTVYCLGPSGADEVLRRALAVGADEAVRVDASPLLDSHVVAEALAAAITGPAGTGATGASEHPEPVDLVVCGDHSVDRGTGATPAFLAVELDLAQGLGLVELDTELDVDALRADTLHVTTLRATRRLDGGRREVLDISLPAVVSVEGSVARLRRAPMEASLAARATPITIVHGPHGHPPDAERHPYRPRPRTLPAPHGDSLHRVRQLLDIGGSDHNAELVALAPHDAAARIVAQLREWGYVGASE